MSSTTQQTVDNLTDARSAYHDLITGRAARVVVDQNGERVEFASANRQTLYLYIQQLERELGLGAIPVTRGPAGFLF